MKRKTLFGLTAAALLTACGGSGRQAVPDFDEVKVERTVSISGEKDAPQCHVMLSILQASDTTGEAARRINEAVVGQLFYMEELSVRAAADSFANSYTRDYVRNIGQLYRDDRGDESKRPWYEYRYVITTEVVHLREATTCYKTTLEYYEGGAHGIRQLLTQNFDDATGRKVTLRDILVDGYEQPLSDILLGKLLEKTGAKDMAQLHERGFLYSMDMYPSENYILSDDGVTFVYNPYEIAPYSEGMIELNVGKDELNELLKT